MSLCRIVKFLTFTLLATGFCTVEGGGQYRFGIKVKDGNEITFERNAVLDMSCFPADTKLLSAEELKSLFKLKLENAIREWQPIQATTTAEQPSTMPTDQPATTATEEPTTMTTEQPTTMATEEPTTMTTEQPTTIATEEPTTMTTEQPTTMATEEPTTMTTEQPATTVTEQPATTAAEEPTTMATEEPTTMTTVQPATTVNEQPATTAAEEPTTTAAEEPKTMTTEQPATEQPTTMAAEEPTTMATEEPTTMTTEQPATTATEQPATTAAEEPITMTTEEPTTTAENLCALSTVNLPRKPWNTSLAVYWSMDSHDGNMTLPDCGGPEWNFVTSNAKRVPGVIGSALLVKENLLLRKAVMDICLNDLDACTSGLSLLFWLKVEKWGSQYPKALFRTTTNSVPYPGIFLGSLNVPGGARFSIFFRTGTTGKQYQAEFPRSLLSGGWIHVAVIWDVNSGISVALNGSVLTKTDDYKSNCKIVKEMNVTERNFRVGKQNGLEFLLDEVKIYYTRLTDVEINGIYKAMPVYSTVKLVCCLECNETQYVISTCSMGGVAPHFTQNFCKEQEEDVKETLPSCDKGTVTACPVCNDTQYESRLKRDVFQVSVDDDSHPYSSCKLT